MERGRESRPSRAASACACSRAASKSVPCSISPAPKDRIAAFFSTELPCGTTMLTGDTGAPPGVGEREPVVAAGGGNHAPHIRPRTGQAVEVGEPAAHLEGAAGRVVLGA